MSVLTQLFDDGSTLTYSPDYSYLTATPSDAAGMVQRADGQTGGFFSVLDSFGGLVTNVGNTVTSLTNQVNAIGMAREKNELARYQATAAVAIGKAQADAAVANARSLSGAGGGLGSLLPLLLLGGVAYAVSQHAG